MNTAPTYSTHAIGLPVAIDGAHAPKVRVVPPGGTAELTGPHLFMPLPDDVAAVAGSIPISDLTPLEREIRLAVGRMLAARASRMLAAAEAIAPPDVEDGDDPTAVADLSTVQLSAVLDNDTATYPDAGRVEELKDRARRGDGYAQADLETRNVEAAAAGEPAHPPAAGGAASHAAPPAAAEPEPEHAAADVSGDASDVMRAGAAAEVAGEDLLPAGDDPLDLDPLEPTAEPPAPGPLDPTASGDAAAPDGRSTTDRPPAPDPDDEAGSAPENGPSRAEVIECIGHLAKPTLAAIVRELEDYDGQVGRTRPPGDAYAAVIDRLEDEGAIARAGTYRGGVVYRLTDRPARTSTTEAAAIHSRLLDAIVKDGRATVQELAQRFNTHQALVASELSILEKHDPPLVEKGPSGRWAATADGAVAAA